MEKIGTHSENSSKNLGLIPQIAMRSTSTSHGNFIQRSNLPPATHQCRALWY
jgi:hypothetical protein